MTRLQAARAAADLKRLGIDVECVEGHYGELTVLVGDDVVVDAGPLGFLGVLPSLKQIREAVRRRLADHRG